MDGLAIQEATNRNSLPRGVDRNPGGCEIGVKPLSPTMTGGEDLLLFAWEATTDTGTNNGGRTERLNLTVKIKEGNVSI
jgi:hypothetical protein